MRLHYHLGFVCFWNVILANGRELWSEAAQFIPHYKQCISKKTIYLKVPSGLRFFFTFANLLIYLQNFLTSIFGRIQEIIAKDSIDFLHKWHNSKHGDLARL